MKKLFYLLILYKENLSYNLCDFSQIYLVSTFYFEFKLKKSFVS